MALRNYPKKLSEDIELNISKLRETIFKYIRERDINKKKKLIIDASFLIEKTIFYIQLEKGVDKVATYKYDELSEVSDPHLLLKLDFDNDKDQMKNLFLLRKYIVEEYKKYKKKTK